MEALIIIKQKAEELCVCETILCSPEEEEDVLEYKYYEYLFNRELILDSCIGNRSAQIYDENGDIFTFIIKKIK